MRLFAVRSGCLSLRAAAAAALSAACVALAPSAASAIKLSPMMAEMYRLTETAPPAVNQMMVCYGFVCRRKLVILFSPAERAALTGILAGGKASAEDERKALQRAFVWFDKRVAREVGTAKRVARADFRSGNDAGNFDCFDTTRNAVSLLLIFQEWGLIRHHTIADPKYRGNWLVGQTPHNTAVLKDKKTGQDWVIDMWTTSFGQVPDVMTVEKWMTEN